VYCTVYSEPATGLGYKNCGRLLQPNPAEVSLALVTVDRHW